MNNNFIVSTRIIPDKVGIHIIVSKGTKGIQFICDNPSKKDEYISKGKRMLSEYYKKYDSGNRTNN